eukprot:356055-Chlamydomonas_euryale.AAC.5
MSTQAVAAASREAAAPKLRRRRRRCRASMLPHCARVPQPLLPHAVHRPMSAVQHPPTLRPPPRLQRPPPWRRRRPAPPPAPPPQTCSLVGRLPLTAAAPRVPAGRQSAAAPTPPAACASGSP